MEDTKVLIGPDGLRVELDRRQVDHKDPGNGTPALVVMRGPRGNIQYSSTYHCACGTAWLDGEPHGGMDLTPEQIEWLQKLEDEIGDFLQW